MVDLTLGCASLIHLTGVGKPPPVLPHHPHRRLTWSESIWINTKPPVNPSIYQEQVSSLFGRPCLIFIKAPMILSTLTGCFSEKLCPAQCPVSFRIVPKVYICRRRIDLVLFCVIFELHVGHYYRQPSGAVVATKKHRHIQYQCNFRLEICPKGGHDINNLKK